MYQDFHGLRELPFELTPNTKYLFLSPHQREALSNLQYGLLSAKSLTLVIGEAGTGKTTLIRAAVESGRCSHVRCVYLNNPVLNPEDFLRTLATRFKLSPAAAVSKSALLDELEGILRERRACGELTALVVDEAQSLSLALLEEIRLLANIETADAKLLSLVLAGQPHLGERLEHPDLRQLKQRVTLRCELQPFTLSDTGAYMATRITKAGGVPGRLFTMEAVTLIHEASGGIPRVINVICDNALVTAMAIGRAPVDRAIVADVCRDLRLLPANGADRPTGRDVAANAAPVRVAADAEHHALSEAEELHAGNGHGVHRSWLRFRARIATARNSNRIITE
jgi:type II secretory pathway predicted ATPase ExeA